MSSLDPGIPTSLDQLTQRGKPRRRLWRDLSEILVKTALVLCTSFTLIITALIIGILAFETGRFFAEVSISEFLFTTQWSPMLGETKSFGIWPLVAGTLLVTLVAAIFALPIGLVTAIFLSEYAPSRVRTVLKPVLEILAGIPTVVYGFFAVIIIAPSLQATSEFLTGDRLFGTYSAGAAGIQLTLGGSCVPLSYGSSWCLRHDHLDPVCRADDASVAVPAYCIRQWVWRRVDSFMSCCRASPLSSSLVR